MKNKIVLEEHFATADTIGDSQEYFPAEIWPERRRQLLDFQTERLERMDACGIGFAILSLNAPAIQGIPDSARTTATTSAAAMPPDSSTFPITSDVRQTQRSGAPGGNPQAPHLNG